MPKQYPKELASAYEEFSNHAFDLILMKRYTLASRLLEFLVNWKDDNLPETYRRIMTINLANSYKFLEEKEKAIKVIDNYQWGALANNFQICEAAVRDDIAKVCRLLPSFEHDNSISKNAFRTWPVFHWAREDKKFATVFESTFGEKLMLVVPEQVD